jgi:protein disulfide-isomerase
MDGQCPVTMMLTKQWVPGDRRWGAIHRGRTYLFAGPEQQKQFLTDPDRFSPTLSGDDPVVALDGRQAVPGRREHGLIYQQHIYLFSSEETLKRFSDNPARYATEVQQALRSTTLR